MNDDVRVVVVDDTVDAAESLADLLTLNGYVVRVAHGGEEAIVLIDAWRPHCVLLDVNMPDINGLELAQRLRDRYVDDIVLIAVSGGDEKQDPVVAKTFDLVDHYLRKPDYLAALLKVLPPLNA